MYTIEARVAHQDASKSIRRFENEFARIYVTNNAKGQRVVVLVNHNLNLNMQLKR